jgi:hypothetical protein
MMRSLTNSINKTPNFNSKSAKSRTILINNKLVKVYLCIKDGNVRYKG